MLFLHCISLLLFVDNARCQFEFLFGGQNAGMGGAADPYGMFDPFFTGGGGLGVGGGMGANTHMGGPPAAPDPSMQNARLTMAEEQMAEVMGESPQNSPERQRIDRLIQETGGRFTGDAAPLNYLVEEYMMTTPPPTPPPTPMPVKAKAAKRRPAKRRNRNRQGRRRNGGNQPNGNGYMGPAGPGMGPPSPKPTRPSGRIGKQAPYKQRPRHRGQSPNQAQAYPSHAPQTNQAYQGQPPIDQMLPGQDPYNQMYPNQPQNKPAYQNVPPSNNHVYQNQPPTNQQNYQGLPPANNQAYQAQPPAYNHGYQGPPPANNQGYQAQPPANKQGYQGPPPANNIGYQGHPPANNQGYQAQPPAYNHGYQGPPPATNQGYQAQPPAHNQGYQGPPPANNQGYQAQPTANRQGYQGPSPANNQGYQGPPPANNQGYKAQPPANNQGYQGPPSANNQGYKAQPPANNQGYQGPPSATNQGYQGPPPANNQGYQGPPQANNQGQTKTSSYQSSQPNSGPTHDAYRPAKASKTNSKIRSSTKSRQSGPAADRLRRIEGRINSVSSKLNQARHTNNIAQLNDLQSQLDALNGVKHILTGGSSNTNNMKTIKGRSNIKQPTPSRKPAQNNAPYGPPKINRNNHNFPNNGQNKPNNFQETNIGGGKFAQTWMPDSPAPTNQYQPNQSPYNPAGNGNVYNQGNTGVHPGKPTHKRSPTKIDIMPYQNTGPTADPYLPYEQGVNQQSASHAQQTSVYNQGMNQQQPVYDPYAAPYDQGMHHQTDPFAQQPPVYQGMHQQGPGQIKTPGRRDQRRKQGRRQGRRRGAAAPAPVATTTPAGTTVPPKLGDTKLMRGQEYMYVDQDGFDTFQWVKKSTIPASQLDHLPQNQEPPAKTGAKAEPAPA